MVKAAIIVDSLSLSMISPPSRFTTALLASTRPTMFFVISE